MFPSRRERARSVASCWAIIFSSELVDLVLLVVHSPCDFYYKRTVLLPRAEYMDSFKISQHPVCKTYDGVWISRRPSRKWKSFVVEYSIGTISFFIFVQLQKWQSTTRLLFHCFLTQGSYVSLSVRIFLSVDSPLQVLVAVRLFILEGALASGSQLLI